MCICSTSVFGERIEPRVCLLKRRRLQFKALILHSRSGGRLKTGIHKQTDQLYEHYDDKKVNEETYVINLYEFTINAEAVIGYVKTCDIFR